MMGAAQVRPPEALPGACCRGLPLLLLLSLPLLLL
jgi:hypothetical protein